MSAESRPVREDQHGRTGYNYGCRCEECTKANSDHVRDWQRQRSAEYHAVNASRDEVRQWASGLGFFIPPSMKGRAADALIARFNREHPDRTYVRKSERAA